MSGTSKSGQQSPAEDYVATYYPGVADAGQAVAVQVGPGAKVEGIDIRLARARVVRVRGKVVAPENARSPFTFVGLMEASSGSPVAGRSYQTLAKAGGTFDLDGVQPGRYLLQCNSAMDSEQLRCRQWIDVGDVDVEGIQARPTPARKIEGKLTTEAQTPLPENLQALLMPREDDPTHMGVGLAPIKPDGSFVFEQVYEGRYDLIVAKLGGEPDQFYAKAVRFGDKDALEEGLDVGGAKTGKLEVVLGDDGGTFECKVVSATGEPVEGAHVLLVPDAPRQHALILYGEAQTDEKGECKITGMAPGAYHAFAFDSKQEIDFRHPESLKPFEGSSKPVEFAAKQSVQLELTAIR